ncbi:hypothetical protein ACH4XT_35170 [Streptomyces avidinii]|uniref:hypothetical protein n=1 Tax=Streptomyces avidinii TaxID=1895 RepID=UPI0037BCAB65
MTWLIPHCGRCDTGRFAQRDRTARLHCTNPHCDHWIHPRELVDIHEWALCDDGTVIVRIVE